jgi:glutamate-1-semialdehyde 2,1-aminomutase
VETQADLDRLRARASEIAAAEGKRLAERTRESARMFDRASAYLPLGVASSFQTMEPYPVYLARGAGSRLWDVDGNAYLDYHNGFGVTICGHGHPKIVEAIDRAARNGTHFAAMTEAAVTLAAELCRRFRLDRVRFANSGTESTMEAIRVARAATGRSVLVKAEGAYHGHHDLVMISVAPGPDDLREPAAGPGGTAPWQASLPRVPFSKGIPEEIPRQVLVVPFNDIAALEQVLNEYGANIAAFIIEPVMMFAGIVLPEPGYLERVRELCTQHGVVLIFDEVKTGVNIAAGGATELFGVRPDLACFAKAIGGGVPIGAFGGRADVMEIIERGESHLGTFNGNPLAMNAGVAALTDVLTPGAHQHIAEIGTQLATGCRGALAENSIAAHVIDLGAKGGVGYRPAPLRNYRDSFECAPEFVDSSSAALMNRGVFQIPADKGQWMLSVQHTAEDIAAYIQAFGDYCAMLAGGK